jgi:hypothetical protein
MSISLHIEVCDPDLENLLTHLDGLTHLNRASKEYLLIRSLDWLRRSDKFAYKNPSVAEVTLTIDGNPVFSPSSGDSKSPHTPAAEVPRHDTVQQPS